MRSCFSIEHFSYDSDVVVDKGKLDNHYQYWVAKSRRGFKPLFDSIHIKDEVKMDESDVNLVNKWIDMQKLIMNQAWKKAKEELDEEQLGKMLQMKFGNPAQIADSLRAEALFDKLLKKHVMMCAFSHSKVEVNCLKGLNILALI
jgi:hypothetical protein